MDFAARVKLRLSFLLLAAGLIGKYYDLLATSRNQLNAELRRTYSERQEIAHCTIIKMDVSVILKFNLLHRDISICLRILNR